MNKKILYVSFMCILILTSIFYLGKLLRPTNTDIAINTIDTFHDMPANSIEVISYGSSRVWRGLDPLEMYANYGIGAYNYGCNWQRFNTTYLFLLDSLQTQSPKIVLIEVKNVSYLLTNTNLVGEVFYTTSIDVSNLNSGYLFQVFGTNLDRYLSYYIPVIAFHENWKSLTESSFSSNINTTDFYASMGYVEGDTVTSVAAVDSSTFEECELPEASVSILDSMVTLCHDNDVDIIFYVTPFSGTYNYSDAMASYAESNNCVYFDMFDYIDELGISWETDFQDSVHLNDDGADKISNFLAEYIVNNYDVTDMRTIEDNLWEQTNIE